MPRKTKKFDTPRLIKSMKIFREKKTTKGELVNKIYAKAITENRVKDVEKKKIIECRGSPTWPNFIGKKKKTLTARLHALFKEEDPEMNMTFRVQNQTIFRPFYWKKVQLRPKV